MLGLVAGVGLEAGEAGGVLAGEVEEVDGGAADDFGFFTFEGVLEALDAVKGGAFGD